MDFSNRIMVSFDVKSLFTNVPVEECISFLRRKLPEVGLGMPVPVDVFVELFSLCVGCCYFSFNVDFYNQKNGLPMGSPKSLVLSNIFFMEYFKLDFLPTVVGKRNIK